MDLKLVLHHVTCILADLTVRVYAVEQELRSKVRCHNDDCILKVHGPALAIRNMTVVKHLQEHIEDIRMGFLHLVEEDYGERLSANGLCELTALIVTNISRRRSDQTGDGEFLHILAHIDAHHIVLIIEKVGGKCPCQFGLADTGRTKEQERTDRTFRILYTCLGAQDRVRNTADRLILADDSLVKLIFKVKDFLPLSLCQLGYRDACPL